MAEEQLYGAEGIERDLGFVPIPEPAPGKPDEPPLETSINNWAADREREQEAKPLIDRSYVRTDGEKIGEHYPDQGTVSAERAARDLAENREAEAAIAELDRNQQLAAEIDAARGLQPEQPASEVLEVLEQQPHTPPVSELQQPQSPPADNGIDPEVAAALRNPKVLSAIQQQRAADVAKVDSAINAAAEWAQTNATIAAAAILNRPELKNIPPSQFPGAFAALVQSNPVAAAEIQSQISQVQALSQQVQEAQRVQQQRVAIQFQQFGKASDDAFDKSMAGETPETVRAIKETAMQMLRETGLSDADLAFQWNNNGLLRSAQAQGILADAARYRMLKAGIPNKVARPTPNVQRPGSSVDRPDASERDSFALEQRFRGPLNVKEAAQLLQGRRARSR